MGRGERYRIAPDPRWESVEGCDGLGRGYYTWLPKLRERFGSLVVVERTETGGDKGRVKLLCDCGREENIGVRSLRRQGYTECIHCRSARRSASFSGTKTIQDKRLRSLWGHRRTGAISRCENPLCKAYKNYGARGISFYQPWKEDKELFFQYAITLDGWDNPKLDMDRTDNEGNYEPGNIRLISRGENSRNKRPGRMLTFEGREQPVMDFWRTECPKWKSPNSVIHYLEKGLSGDAISKIYRETRGRL